MTLLSPMWSVKGSPTNSCGCGGICIEMLPLRLPAAIDPLDPCDPSTEIGRRRADLERLEREILAENRRLAETDVFLATRTLLVKMEVIDEAFRQLDRDSDAFWEERRRLHQEARARCRAERERLERYEPLVAAKPAPAPVQRRIPDLDGPAVSLACRRCPSPPPIPPRRKDNSDTQWAELVKSYQGGERKRDGCGMAVLQQNSRAPDLHRTVHVSCGCWDCGHCAPRLAARWHQHLVDALSSAGVIRKILVAGGRAWETLQRRIQRAGASYIRALRSDGDFEVLTTLDEGEPVPDHAAAVRELLTGVPRAQTTARKVSTSRDWSLAASEAEPVVDHFPEPKKMVEAEDPWTTLGQVTMSPAEVVGVLEKAAVPCSLVDGPEGVGHQAVVRFRAAPGTAYYQAVIQQILGGPRSRPTRPPRPDCASSSRASCTPPVPGTRCLV